MKRLLAMTPLVLTTLLATMGVEVQAQIQQSLAFVSLRDGNPHIYRKDGMQAEYQLTRGTHSNSQPVWSPDGRSIAFTSTRDGLAKIYLMNGDGHAQRRLTTHERVESSPSWSPDGKVIAYVSRDPKAGITDLRLAELTTGAEVVVTGNGKGLTPPVWSLNGRRLAFVAADSKGTAQIWVVERDGSGLREVSSKVSKRSKASPSLSPDGRQVAYIADFREKIDIVVTDLQTLETRNLTNSPQGVKNENPAWSPDGGQLIFGSTRDDESRLRMDLFTMKPDGTAIENLTRHPHEDFNAKWTQNSKEIVFTSLRDGISQIYAVELKTGNTRRLTSGTFNDTDHAVAAPAPSSGGRKLGQHSD